MNEETAFTSHTPSSLSSIKKSLKKAQNILLSINPNVESSTDDDAIADIFKTYFQINTTSEVFSDDKKSIETSCSSFHIDGTVHESLFRFPYSHEYEN